MMGFLERISRWCLFGAHDEPYYQPGGICPTCGKRNQRG